MRTRETFLTKTIMALAVLAAFAPARAQESDATALKRPDSSVRLGVGITPGNERDRTIWSQYNGMREGDTHLLLDLDYVKRNDETGFWTTLRGRNLGLDSRDAAATIQRQGDWRINLEAGELVHHEIRTTNSGMGGAGPTNPTIRRPGREPTPQRWAVIRVPEPVSFNMKQIDAKVNFTSGKLFLSGGYYGSFFNNAYGNVQPTGAGAFNGPTGGPPPLH